MLFCYLITYQYKNINSSGKQGLTVRSWRIEKVLGSVERWLLDDHEAQLGLVLGCSGCHQVQVVVGTEPATLRTARGVELQSQ